MTVRESMLTGSLTTTSNLGTVSGLKMRRETARSFPVIDSLILDRVENDSKVEDMIATAFFVAGLYALIRTPAFRALPWPLKVGAVGAWVVWDTLTIDPIEEGVQWLAGQIW